MLTCNNFNGVGVALMKTLHVFNPRYTEEDVLMSDLDPEFPQVEWFIANALFYISNKYCYCSVKLRVCMTFFPGLTFPLKKCMKTDQN